MFNSKDVSLIILDYFDVVMCASDVCEIVSQNGDHWMILKKQATVPRGQLKHTKHFDYTFLLYHRHSGSKGFHLHSEYTSVLDTVLDIINHDDYRLKRKGRTYFDEVVETYS